MKYVSLFNTVLLTLLLAFVVALFSFIDAKFTQFEKLINQNTELVNENIKATQRIIFQGEIDTWDKD